MVLKVIDIYILEQ